MNLTGLTDEQLLTYMQSHQEIQKRNPPNSSAWRKASHEIHRAIRENGRRYPVSAKQPDNQ